MRYTESGVVIRDPKLASRLHNRGFTGVPQPGGGLVLAPAEAAYWAERGALKPPGGLTELLSRFPATLPTLAVYRDLKERGLVVKPDGDGFRLFDRGADPRGAASAQVVVREERSPLVVAALADAQPRVGRLQLAVVDGDSDVTHYGIAREKWDGSDGDGDGGGFVTPEGAWRGANHGALVRLTRGDPAPLAAAGFGRAAAEEYWLTPLEARYLADRGLLTLDGEAAVVESAVEPVLYDCYRALRDRGYRLGTGFKFGTHFRVYRRDDTHAAWLVLLPPVEMAWSALARAVRVAHGVRKRLVLRLPDDWLRLAWLRP